MILRFSVENFRSFKDETTLNFVSSSHIPFNPGHKYRFGRLGFIKNVGIFGANASGKSTIIAAIGVLKNIILGEGIDGNLAFKGRKNVPTRFEIAFETNGRFFQYELAVKEIEGLSDPSIVSESLYELFKTKEPELIYDSKKGIQKTDEEEMRLYEKRFRQVTGIPFLKYIVAPERRNRKSRISNTFWNVYLFFARKIHVYAEHGEMLLAIQEKSVELIKDKLHDYDTGIEEVLFIDTIEEEKNRLASSAIIKEQAIDPLYKKIDTLLSTYYFDGSNIFMFKIEDGSLAVRKLAFKHAGIEKHFTFEEESDGTKVIFLLLALLMGNDNSDRALFVDEIEMSSHPVVVRRLIQDFQSLNKDSKSQLVFTTHMVELMDTVLKKDEIYFVEKNDYGVSHIKSLLEFKSTNHREKYASKYIEGRYGALPNIAVRIDTNATA